MNYGTLINEYVLKLEKIESELEKNIDRDFSKLKEKRN